MKDQITEKEQKKLDNILNKAFIDLGVFSLMGYAFGVGVGIFFKNKHFVRNLTAGFGGSYGILRNRQGINTII
jgi:hypothetical protein